MGGPKGGRHFLLAWFHFWGGCLWHFPSSDLHEIFCTCPCRQKIDLRGFLGFSALINLLMTSNDFTVKTSSLCFYT